jgi:hypothetical protein
VLQAYADEHVVHAIVQALRQRGMDVVTVQDRAREQADDGKLLAEALREHRIMLTNDKDFLAIAATCAAHGETFAPIFFWPQQRRRIGDIVRSVIREASKSDYASACSRVYFL